MNIILFDKEERTFVKTDERYQHLKKVLHVSCGSEFKGGEINGQAGVATITHFDEDCLTFEFKREEDASALHPITLILGQVRPICMRRILRESVSLGVERLLLVISDLGEKSYSNATLYTDGTYESILLDGAMQSGKTGVTKVEFYSSVDEVLKTELTGDKLLLDPRKGMDRLSKFPFNSKTTVLAIGPERGWSEREINLFLKNNFTPLLMGDRILRTETAVVTAISLSLAGMNLI